MLDQNIQIEHQSMEQNRTNQSLEQEQSRSKQQENPEKDAATVTEEELGIVINNVS